MTQQEDRIIWMPNANGNFTTSSARGHLSNLSSSNHTILFDWLWNQKLPPRVLNFLWKTITDILPTKSRLNRFYHCMTDSCVMCNSMTGNREHLFFGCVQTNQVIQIYNNISGFQLALQGSGNFINDLSHIMSQPTQIKTHELHRLSFL